LSNIPDGECTMSDLNPAYRAAAQLLGHADGLMITAGAGMGVDSGLPDFRGDEGFWKAYPMLGELGIGFAEMANPRHFASDPAMGWGFYGHRLQLYRATDPHAGFARLLDIAAQLEHGAFVFTSNVDGHFQKAGFADDRIVECHGSIHHLQCMEKCGQSIWEADAFMPEIDHAKCRLMSEPPRCPNCGGLARPNILMFGDWDWDESRARGQLANLQDWIDKVARLVVIELGAGTAVATVRAFSERLDCPLVRVNPTDCEVPKDDDVSLAAGALAGIEGIAAALAEK
jgi:NAD-dependent SIR2 family protein deacetylase